MSFVAISKVSFPEELKTVMHEVGRKMLPIARNQKGYITVALHQSIEKNETMMYWEWETSSDHESCMKSDDWSALMSEYGASFAKEGVRFSIETFERIE